MSKKLVFLFCLLSLSFHICAQVIYERTYPDEFPSIHNPIELSDTSTFSLGTNDECNGIRSRHIDVRGNELSDNIVYAEGFSSGYHWIGHDSILIWVEHGAHDVGPDSFRVNVWTPNEMKEVLSVGVPFDFSPERRYGAYLYAPDRLVYEKWDTLYTKNLYTEVLEDSMIISGIRQIIEFEKAILVLSESQSPLVLDEHLNNIYEWVDLSSLPFAISDAVVLDSFLIGKKDMDPTSIVNVNIYNEVQQEIDLSAYFDQIEDVQANKNMLFIKGVFNGESFVLQMNEGFTVISFTKLDMPSLDKEMTFTYYPDRVYAWGFDGLSGYNANYRMSYTYIEPGPVKYLDVALDSVWVDSVYFPNLDFLPALVYIVARVRNLSPEPIQSVTIHWKEEASWCNPEVHSMSYDGLSINPDDVGTVTLATWSYAVAHGIPFIKTFLAEHGNHHFDLDTTNNSFELNYLLSSIGELIPSSISISPNPFTDNLQTSVSDESIQLDLYNLTGNKVSTGFGRLDNLDQLLPGIYFLQIQSGKSIIVERVVKVE